MKKLSKKKPDVAKTEHRYNSPSINVSCYKLYGVAQIFAFLITVFSSESRCFEKPHFSGGTKTICAIKAYFFQIQAFNMIKFIFKI